MKEFTYETIAQLLLLLIWLCVCVYAVVYIEMHNSTITKPFGTTSMMVNRIAFDFNFIMLYTRVRHDAVVTVDIIIVAHTVCVCFSHRCCCFRSALKYSSTLVWVPFALVWVFCFVVSVILYFAFFFSLVF